MSADPRAVGRAQVFKGEALAGYLSRVPGSDDVLFDYDPAYLASGMPPVATTLPLSVQVQRSRGGAVPPFFAGLLPEGRRLEALIRSTKTSADDELSLLLTVGADCIGDVRVLADGAPSPALQVTLSDPEQVCFHEVFERAIDPVGALRSEALPGVQDKISASTLSLPVRFAGTEALLKLSPVTLPRLVENEAHMLSLAAACGLAVPRSQVLTDRDGHTGLLVGRFDRTRTAAGLVRIAQEDAVQLAGRWPAGKYRMSTREVFAATLAVTPAKAATALHLLRLFAFSYAIGNGDLHAKNISVYAPDGHLWQLTPAYDLVSTLPYGDHRMALSLEGRDDNLTGASFTAVGEVFGVPTRATHRMLAELSDRLSPLTDGVAAIGFNDRRTTHLITVMRKRLADLTRWG